MGKIIYSRKKAAITKFEELTAHPSLKFVVIVASCYVAFAIGSNNVANAAGPIASMVLKELNISSTGDNFLLIMILATLIIAPCFGIGSSILGYRVVQTTGKEIIQLGPIGATFISIITATLALKIISSLVDDKNIGCSMFYESWCLQGASDILLLI